VLRGYADTRARSRDPADRTRKATAALPKTLRVMLAELDRSTLIGKRDAALLLLGFATAARASEPAAVDITDVTFVGADDEKEKGSGLLVNMYRGKVRTLTDFAVPYGQKPSTCPVRAVLALVEAMATPDPKRNYPGCTTGPLFVRVDRHGRIAPPMRREGRDIGDPSGRITAQASAQVVERAADDAGLSGAWSGHSLRRGFATAARQAGHDLVTIGRHGGWKDGSKALLGYFEDVDKWEDNPLSGTGL
jgi:integrase